MDIITAGKFVGEWMNGVANCEPLPLLGLGAAVSVAAIVANLLNKSERDAKKTHGNARFAEVDEMSKAGLLHNDGSKMVLASMGNKFIGAATHALIIAPTGSGKGVGPVLCSCLSYRGSLVVNDPKGENYKISGRYRESLGQDVVPLDPWGVTNNATGQCNPLEYINHDSPEAISQIDDLTTAICGETSSGGDNSYFYQAARSFVRFCIMITIAKYENTDKCNLTTTFDLVFSGKDETLSLLEDATTMSHFSGKLAKIATSLQKSALDKESEFSKAFLSVMSNAEVYFDFLMDNQLCHFFQKNTVDFRKIQDEDNRASIFIITSPDRAANAKVFLRIVYTMIFAAQYKHKQEKGGLPLLVIVDEMAQLGTFKLLENGLTIVRGYGIRLMLIVQDLAQLKANYGEGAGEFQSNTSTVFFGSKSLAVCKEISDLLGNKTVKQVSKDSKGRGTTSETAQALMSVDEVAALPADTALIFAEGGLRPIKAKKLYYYSDKRFAGRWDEK